MQHHNNHNQYSIYNNKGQSFAPARNKPIQLFITYARNFRYL